MNNLLLFYSEELKKMLRPTAPEHIVTVQRGLLLYRQDMVYNKSALAEKIEASVQDVVPCKVELDLQFPSMSTCSCRQPVPCRHQLAVFFSSYEEYGSVSEWVQVWKDNRKTADLSILQIQKAKALLEESEVMEQSYEGWKKFMSDTFRTQVLHSLMQPSYTFSVKWAAYQHRVKSKMPLEAEWKLLYTFTMHFHTFLLIMKSMESKEISNSAVYFLQREAQESADQLIYNMGMLIRVSRPFAFDAFFDGIKKDLHELLKETRMSEQGMEIYRRVWTDLLKEKSWREQEWRFLTGGQEDTKGTDSDSLLVAKIHLAYLLDKESAMLDLLTELKPEQFRSLLFWINVQDEKKSAPFISFLIGKIGDYLGLPINYYAKKEFIVTVTPPVLRHCMHMDKMDVFEQFCENNLPYTFIPYSNYLLQSGSHKKWVELFIYHGVDVDHIASDDLKAVMQSNPSLLLPLFTSIVNEKIANKNRQSYRAAVRYMKKIRTICKKEKEMDKWERYLARIQASTKRLRAFQEELKRGKLIDAD